MCAKDLCTPIFRVETTMQKTMGKDNESPGTPVSAEQADRAVISCSEASAVSGDGVGHDCSIFFARVPPLVPYEDLLRLFNKYGTVEHLNLFRRWATAKTSKGCGTVLYSKPEEAGTALLGLNGVHSFEGFPGNEGPMVVEWMDPSRLTSPDAAAALKAAKAKEAKAAAAKLQHNKPRAKGSSSSNVNNGPLPAGWQFVQQLNALAQSRALAAAAAAVAVQTASCNTLSGAGGMFSSLQPAADALDMSGFMGISSLNPEGCSAFSSGALGDPRSWGTVIPVHLLPTMSQVQQPPCLPQSNLSTLSSLLNPAATLSHQLSPLGPLLQPSPGHGVQQQCMPSPGSMSGCAGDFLSATASGPLGWSTSTPEPWMMGLTHRTESSDASFTSQMSGLRLDGPAAFAAAAAAAAGAVTPSEQQQCRPLVVFDEPWAVPSCDGLASAANNSGAGHNIHSSSCGRFDSLPLLGQLQESARAQGMSSSILSAGGRPSSTAAAAATAAAHESAPGFLAGGFPQGGALSCERHVSGFSLNQPRNSFAGTGSAQQLNRPGEGYQLYPGASGGSSSIDAVTESLLLDDSSLGQLPLIPQIANISGVMAAVHAGPGNATELVLTGSAAAVTAAKNLLKFLQADTTARA